MPTTLEPLIQKQIEEATVRIIDANGNKVGQGVLVPGGYILTAAHCTYLMYAKSNERIRSCDLCCGPLQTRSEYLIGNIETKDGTRVKVRPISWEPIADIALLGGLDPVAHYADSERFDDFSEETSPVRLCQEMNFPKTGMPVSDFQVHIFSHKRVWLSGKGSYGQGLGEIAVRKLNHPLESGTSGGPVVNDLGQLVGIVSQGTNGGNIPYPPYALPRHLWDWMSKNDR